MGAAWPEAGSREPASPCLGSRGAGPRLAVRPGPRDATWAGVKTTLEAGRPRGPRGQPHRRLLPAPSASVCGDTLAHAHSRTRSRTHSRFGGFTRPCRRHPRHVAASRGLDARPPRGAPGRPGRCSGTSMLFLLPGDGSAAVGRWARRAGPEARLLSGGAPTGAVSPPGAVQGRARAEAGRLVPRPGGGWPSAGQGLGSQPALPPRPPRRLRGHGAHSHGDAQGGRRLRGHWGPLRRHAPGVDTQAPQQSQGQLNTPPCNGDPRCSVGSWLPGPGRGPGVTMSGRKGGQRPGQVSHTWLSPSPSPAHGLVGPPQEGRVSRLGSGMESPDSVFVGHLGPPPGPGWTSAPVWAEHGWRLAPPPPLPDPWRASRPPAS